MIITLDENTAVEDLLCVEMRRPSFFPEQPQYQNYWIKVHDIVKSSDIPIIVNKIFWGIDGLLKEPDSAYVGGGVHTYNFWVKNISDKNKFLDMLQAIQE